MPNYLCDILSEYSSTANNQEVNNMPQITEETQFSAGQYSIVADVGTGDVTLQISVNGDPVVNITDGVFTVDTTSIIDLPLCKITPILTGTATVSIDSLKS